MNATDETRRAFVESLARENREFYGTSEGHGLLRALKLTSEHRWIYLFELVQNAIDAGARSIALRLSESESVLTFQHDGTSAIGEKNVVGLSKVFRSTKGASSVGFMGIGFKSVFKRFAEARVSGWGWAFRYEVRQVKGEWYGDVQPDLLGAVIPIWDEAIEEPEAGFTTRFEMCKPVDSEADLQTDLKRFLPDEDRTLLSILADSGLTRLDINGCMWELGVDDEPEGSREATALSPDEELLWQLFPVKLKPSREAVARFLEHRSIQPTEAEREQVYAEAARARRVLGVLPLDDNGTPAPPERGRVYATLPTEVTLPFGLHINADWLPSISRTGLPEVDENTWQREIVDRIAEVLASLLHWAARRFSTPDEAKTAFSALAPPSPEAIGLEALLNEEDWLSRLRSRLEGAPVLPVWTEETASLAFAKPSDTIVPPAPLADVLERQPGLRPAVLLKGPVLVPEVLGSGGRALLDRAGLLVDMSPEELEEVWSDGLEHWWKVLGEEETARRDVLFRLWGAISRLASEEQWPTTRLRCVRTAGGGWLSVAESTFFNPRLPSEQEPGGSKVLQFLLPFLPDESCWLEPAWVRALRQQATKEDSEHRYRRERGLVSWARTWIEDHARQINLRDVVKKAGNALVSPPATDLSALVSLGCWAMHRKSERLLTHVLVESATGPRAVPTDTALLANPYVERGQVRQRLFSTKPVISASYLDQDPSNAGAHEWRSFFEKAGTKGTLVVRQIKRHVDRYDRARVTKFLEQFAQVVRRLAVPSIDSKRIPVARIVRRTGGQLRGTLGGWILPLGRVHERLREELEHTDFPCEFPDTTTGEQALAYLREVWDRARSSPERLASEVGDVLPASYAYRLEDCAKDQSLSERWSAAVSEAAVFVEGEWVVLSEAEDVYFDDLEDRRFFPRQGSLRVATSSHLGSPSSDQIRSAKALGLPFLSSSIDMEWREVGTSPPAADWNPRFELICELVRRVHRNGRRESGSAGAKVEARLRACRELSLEVSVEGAAPEQVPVNARLHNGVLTVAGRPIQFGADAAKELLRSFSFRQRGDLAADLTGMLVAIDDKQDFVLAADKFRRSFAPGVDLPAEFQDTTAETQGAGVAGSRQQTPQEQPTSKEAVHEIWASARMGSPGSFARSRALARPKALARELKAAIKGEIRPEREEDGLDESEGTGRDGDGLGDEVYRRIAAQYEREFGRIPKLGDSHQRGWDLRSVDPKTRATRLIEVKGRGRPWVEDEVVELSRKQAHKAFGVLADQNTDSWYLYVVEQLDDGSYQVLPIANPIHAAAKWILAGESWRMVAEESRRIVFVPDGGDT